MTEQEWLAATDPAPMLAFLRGPAVTELREFSGQMMPFEVYPERRASGRKLRLWAVACCRRHWHLLDEVRCRRLVEVGEQFEGRFNPTGLPLDSCQRAVELAELVADGPVDTQALTAARDAADSFHFPASDYAACYGEEWGPFDTELIASGHAAYAAYYACDTNFDFSSVRGVVWEMAQAVASLRSKGFGKTEQGGDTSERVAQAQLVRDIFGNPTRPVTADPTWLTSTAVTLATGIYAERAFDRLPILADALQDAGCDLTDVLDHCRSKGPHARGCWVVDLVLGKE